MKILLKEKAKFFRAPTYEKSQESHIIRAELINSFIPQISMVIAKTYQKIYEFYEI